MKLLRWRPRRWWHWLAVSPALYFAVCLLGLLLCRWITPPTTMVQMQRRAESWLAEGHYVKRHEPRDLDRISRQLQHAVVAAEDTRFWQHHGIDFEELAEIAEDTLEEADAPRGGSTITQQLVKNLFFTTHRNPARKVLEFVLAPAAELFLSKERILELYLNVIEWGPGVYGAEAASRFHYGVAASAIGRDQAARLAAIIPSPRRRKPARMNGYSRVILARMAAMGY
jgi:monofunctional biosynthetic peptidoglycan transglycosylase